jgi:trigger factor
MSYKIEAVNGCTKKLIFDFKELDLTNEITGAIKAKQKDVSIKGFRKGKAPLSMVEQLYKPQIESDALNSFVQKEFFNAVNKEEIRVVGYPSFENVDYKAGESVKFDALVEIFPEVKVKDMSKFSFTRDKVEVSEEDIDGMRKNYLGSKAEMKETDKALEKGLTAVMNFQGEMENGEKPENMKGEEFMLEIGSGQFIPGFEDGMIGMKKGENKDVKVTFPADYHAAELANASVTFAVELLEVKEKSFPEFTDELAKEFGFESVEDFTTKTKENLTNQKGRAADEKLHQEILEKLVEANEFDVPLALVAQQEDHLKQDLTRTLGQQGFNEQMMKDYFEKWSEDMNTKAIFQVKSGLILDTLAKEHNVECNDDDMNTKMEEMVQGSGLDLEQIKQYYSSDENVKKNFMYAIREEKTFSKIKEIVTVK